MAFEGADRVLRLGLWARGRIGLLILCEKPDSCVSAGYFFAVTYSTCSCSMVPLNLNGTLS
jgi:hypothetical protein